MFNSLSARNAQNNRDELGICLRILDNSLKSRDCLSLTTNPVLRSSSANESNKEQLERVLVQYCFLPAEIINLLSIARSRLSACPSIEAELTRNINEEKGSRTKGISHYEILERGLRKELELDISNSEQSLSTEKFLRALKKVLATSSRAFVIGLIYGLESAAVPELFIVAKLINHYALSVEYSNPIITIPPERSSCNSDQRKYSLDVFFNMHIRDFEVGHKNGLAIAIKKQNEHDQLDRHDFVQGFEFVLDQMDQWWEELAHFVY